VENNKIRNSVFELDSEMAGVSASIEEIEDIETELSILRQNLDDTAVNGAFSEFHIRDTHRKIRMLDSLMSKYVHTLNERFNLADQYREALVKEVLDKEYNAE
jgi:DNA repair ATPase RecN